MGKKVREHTKEEIQHTFQCKLQAIIEYWTEHSGGSHKTKKKNRKLLSSLMFSVLAEIDGSGVTLPGMMLVPLPNRKDRSFAKSIGANYFPYVPKTVERGLCDIAGSLHENFFLYDPTSPRYDKELATKPPVKSL